MARAQDTLCDPAAENCRDRLLNLIRNESVGIDVAFWFMTDARYTAELIRKHQQNVPVRVLVDTRANEPNPINAERINELRTAGIPLRRRTANGILHWKAMIFNGQNTVQMSAANYSGDAFVYSVPYQNYVAEAIYFTADTALVNSFRTKFDDLWTNTSQYANYANINTPLTRTHGTFPIDPELNFAPAQNFRTRSVARYNAEPVGIDATMYRITDRGHTDALINAVTMRGVPVRLITEPLQYRDSARLWHSWNVDRLYMAGVQIRHRAHAGLIHQKSTILHGQQLTVFGSSNWTTPSANSQEEHNLFTYKPYFYAWFTAQFERKWNNTTGVAETQPFAPLPPAQPVYVSPANLAIGQPTASVTLRWDGGFWAHLYDVYFGPTPSPPLVAENVELGPSETPTDYKSFAVSGLAPGTTYYWRVVSKTMALRTSAGLTRSFTTAGDAPPPPPSSTLGPGDISMYASRALVSGSWSVVPDASAAGGSRLWNPNSGQAKVSPASAAPRDYFDLTFTAEAGRPYRLWLRGIAQNNDWANDSVHVQFSGSVDASGAPLWRIGTSSSSEISIENGSGAGLAGWGWQDNGWGPPLGQPVYFATTGVQTIRVQRREDGISIDQLLLSPQLYFNAAPGVTKNDTTILPESAGSGTPPPPPPPSSSAADVVVHALTATLTGTDWRLVSDATAAGGQRLENPDAGLAKVVTAAPAPASYAELTFQAEANTPYRLWLRLRAQTNYWANDSVHLQFSSTVTESGSATQRIGTTSSVEVNLEDCGGCGVSGWGWQDNGYGVGALGSVIYFGQSGTQTVRLQIREDGVSIDQLVLSPSTWMNAAPGSLKGDATILPASSQTSPAAPGPDAAVASEVVLHTASAFGAGGWTLVSDPTAASGLTMFEADAGQPKLEAAATPASYFELEFQARADTAYRLWLRARAQADSWRNDSAHVQFSGSVTQGGSPTYRIGTADSAVVALEDCNGCGVQGWGWQDNGWGRNVLGPLVYFAEDGPQTVRVQTREDGLAIDQVVLSPSRFLNLAPGALQNDNVILVESAGS